MAVEDIVAKLVHGYLKEKRCFLAANAFSAECDILKNPNQTPSAVLPCLDSIVNDYLAFKSSHNESAVVKELNDKVQMLWKQLDVIVNQLRSLTLKKTAAYLQSQNAPSVNAPLTNAPHQKRTITTQAQGARSRHALEQYQKTKKIITYQKPKANPQAVIAVPLHTRYISDSEQTKLWNIGGSGSQRSNVSSANRHSTSIHPNVGHWTQTVQRQTQSARNHALTYNQVGRASVRPECGSDESTRFSDDMDFTVELLNPPQKNSCTDASSGNIHSGVVQSVALPAESPTGPANSCTTVPVNRPVPPKDSAANIEVMQASYSEIDAFDTNLGDTAACDLTPVELPCTPIKRHLVPGSIVQETKSPKRKSIHPKRSTAKKTQPPRDAAVPIPQMQSLDQPVDDLNQLIEILLNAPNLQEKIAENINKAVESVHLHETPEKQKRSEDFLPQDLNLDEVVNLTTHDPAFEELLNSFISGELPLSIDSLQDYIVPPPPSQTTDALSSTSRPCPPLDESMLIPSPSPSLSVSASVDLPPMPPTTSQPVSAPVPVMSTDDTQADGATCSTSLVNASSESELKGVAMDALLMLADCPPPPKTPESPYVPVRMHTPTTFVPLLEQNKSVASPINSICIPMKPPNWVNGKGKSFMGPFGLGNLIILTPGKPTAISPSIASRTSAANSNHTMPVTQSPRTSVRCSEPPQARTLVSLREFTQAPTPQPSPRPVITVARNVPVSQLHRMAVHYSKPLQTQTVVSLQPLMQHSTPKASSQPVITTAREMPASHNHRTAVRCSEPPQTQTMVSRGQSTPDSMPSRPVITVSREMPASHNRRTTVRCSELPQTQTMVPRGQSTPVSTPSRPVITAEVSALRNIAHAASNPPIVRQQLNNHNRSKKRKSGRSKNDESSTPPVKKVPKHFNVDQFLATLNYDE